MTNDSGVAMVQEFHDTWGLPVRPEPGIPELTAGDRWDIAAHAMELKNFAERLKIVCAQAHDLGRDNLRDVLVRMQIIVEETSEVFEAVTEGDVPHVLRELSDLRYSVNGTFLIFGMQACVPEADAELHRANMSKLGADGRPIVSDSGRVVKGPNFVPPDMARVLAERPGGA
jgi:predicted HAD superfamily Cof-like phosphohydrolase